MRQTKRFEFSSEYAANSVAKGDFLYTTSAEFDYCAWSGRFRKTSTLKEFEVEEIIEERILPRDLSQCRNGGDYYYYTWIVR